MEHCNSSIGKPHTTITFLIWFLSISIALLPACASSPAIDNQRPLATQVDSGDYVSAVFKDGSQENIRVTRVENNGMYGNDRFYSFSDISTVTRLDISGATDEAFNVLGAIAVVAVAAAVLGAIAARSD